MAASNIPLKQPASTARGGEARYISLTRAIRAAARGKLVLLGRLMRRINVTSSKNATGSRHSSTAAKGPLCEEWWGRWRGKVKIRVGKV